MLKKNCADSILSAISLTLVQLDHQSTISLLPPQTSHNLVGACGCFIYSRISRQFFKTKF